MIATTKDIYIKAALAAKQISDRYHNAAMAGARQGRGVSADTKECFRLSKKAADLATRLIWNEVAF